MGKLVLVLLFLPLGVQAKFYSLSQLPREAPSEHVKRAALASVSVVDPRSGSCSATFVSHEGHLLTAAHCVESCYSSTTEKVELSKQALEIYRSQKLSGPCPLTIQGKEYSAQVLELGSGWLLFDNSVMSESDWEKVGNLRKEGFGTHGDWALLKVSGWSNQACVPVAAKEPPKNEMLFSVGYPNETFRQNGFDSGGEQVYASFGYRTRGVEDIAGLKEKVRARDLKDLEFSLQILLGTFDPTETLAITKRERDYKGVISSSVDIAQGSSGGGLFNSRGEIMAVNSEVYNLISNPNDSVRRDRTADIPGNSRSASLLPNLNKWPTLKCL